MFFVFALWRGKGYGYIAGEQRVMMRNDEGSVALFFLDAV